MTDKDPGETIAEQLQQTTTEDAGGSVSDGGLDIIFEPEDEDEPD